MEAMFDDLTAALKQPCIDVSATVRAYALDLASKLFLGIAIGIGFAIGMAIAG
ncbi:MULTISPECIES: hypothetical protein [unclassified Mesorhizobium]|uniref:hypothetical protein n=1 Tax=unclassified Mesorhizobium TaxID=325217 RepID=UPI00143F8D34|nr:MULTISPECIES: hypothetical protein [unclassified Mesorhizobium]